MLQVLEAAVPIAPVTFRLRGIEPILAHLTEVTEEGCALGELSREGILAVLEFYLPLSLDGLSRGQRLHVEFLVLLRLLGHKVQLQVLFLSPAIAIDIQVQADVTFSRKRTGSLLMPLAVLVLVVLFVAIISLLYLMGYTNVIKT